MPHTHTHKSNLAISTQTLSRTHIYPQGSKEVLHLCMCVRMCKKNQHIQKERTSGQGVSQEMCVRQGQVKKEETKRFFYISLQHHHQQQQNPPLTSSRPLNRHVRIYLKDINAKIKDEVLHFKMYVYSVPCSLTQHNGSWAEIGQTRRTITHKLCERGVGESCKT